MPALNGKRGRMAVRKDGSRKKGGRKEARLVEVKRKLLFYNQLCEDVILGHKKVPFTL